MLPPAVIPSSGAFLTNARMSSSNDTSLSTVLWTPPSFLLQQLVWPTMTRTMAMTPSSFHLTSMPGIPLIPMPVYGCAYPNNSNSNSNSSNISNILHFAARATATTTTTQGHGYIMTQSPMLPAQPGMLNTQTPQSQSAMYSSMLPSSSNVFPNISQDKQDPYHACLSLKTQSGDDNNKAKAKHETNLFGKDDSLLLSPVCKSSSHSRSVNHEAMEST